MIYMNDTEINMITRLLMNKHEVVNLGKLIDYDFYHLEHYHPMALRSSSTHRKVNPEQPFSRPESMNPNGREWGFIQYPFEKLTISLQVNKFEIINSHPSLCKWIGFVFLVTSSEIQITWDQIVKALWTAGTLWRRRISVARETVHQQPLINWPQLLISHWISKKNQKR